MGLSSIPGEETKKQTDCETATKDLRDRQDNDWALVRLDSQEYLIPKSEGEWEQIVTNRAAAEFYKITDYLSYARRKLFIPIKDEDRKGRKDLTLTEQLANGCIYLADNLESGLPYQIESQSVLSFYRVIRGWSAIRFLLRENEDEDKLVPDVAIWDPRNTYWLVGKNRLVWVCYVSFRTKEEILDEYPGWNGTVGLQGKMGNTNKSQNLTAIYDVWAVEEGKEAQEGVIIGGEYVKEPEDIGLDYLPIRIKAGRSTPFISDTLHSDNIKYVGESFLASTRDLLPVESRLMSYEMTRASQLAKAPVIIEFDGSGNAQPPGMDVDPQVKGRIIYLDTSKGQKFSDRLIPPTGTDIGASISIMQRMLEMGGSASLSLGLPPYPETARATDIIAHIDLQKINPFKLGVESDIKWWAEEIVRQFKNGDFKEYEIEGRDESNNPYNVKVKPDKIDDNWRFQCELIPDLLRDKAANLAWIGEAMKLGLIGVETGRDQSQIVVNTDLESEKIAREQARAVFGIGKMEAFMAFVKDYAKDPTPQNRFLLAFAFKNLQEALTPQQPQGPQRPAQIEQNAAAVPDDIRQAAQRQIPQTATAQGAPPQRVI